MSTTVSIEQGKQMAKRCVECPVCAHARKKQRGIAYWFVIPIRFLWLTLLASSSASSTYVQYVSGASFLRNSGKEFRIQGT